ncbi:hypothetical protein C7M61_002864 [Candidozyma pseudohaemuli]|uniref:Uncharacterized protein n=1 Tax=Candidozyma pseudohaemuli TaxID=418784 RepID=A0A2P7YQU7_9ASCO|nr:hypothetical protein C7M61_002864 [[Candida] pseudohaemulonii]PSK38304.1 hypothetical protein C7M61_002864 [[Candida] pseudohaemulonii]
MRETNRTEVLKYSLDRYATSSAKLKTVLPACAETHNATAFFIFRIDGHTVYLQSIDGVSLRDINELEMDQRDNERVAKAYAFINCILDSDAEFLYVLTGYSTQDDDDDDAINDTPESWAQAAERAADSYFRMQQYMNHHHPKLCIPRDSL